jgi:uncharacterized membrane protein
VKLTTAQWIQILTVAVMIATGWTTVKMSVNSVQASAASLQEQLNQVRRDYLRKDVDAQHDAIYDAAVADAKARMDKLEERMDRRK